MKSDVEPCLTFIKTSEPIITLTDVDNCTRWPNILPCTIIFKSKCVISQVTTKQRIKKSFAWMFQCPHSWPSQKPNWVRGLSKLELLAQIHCQKVVTWQKMNIATIAITSTLVILLLLSPWQFSKNWTATSVDLWLMKPLHLRTTLSPKICYISLNQ